MKKRYQNRYNGGINQIIDEADQITKELGDIAFVGAVAVYLHTKNKSRVTSDLDFAAAGSLSDDYLEEQGYTKHEERGKPVIRTPRGFKIDIYRRDVGEIPVQQIINTAKSVLVGKNKGRGVVKIANLEVLIVAKYRSPRVQDHADLYDIAKTKLSVIDWKSLQSLTKSDHEFQAIRTTVDQYSRLIR
jgi:hypothetical protein